jgi:hypothetical protein
MKENREMHLAVLIDGDNIPYANIKGMMEEIAKFGIPTFKRIYGDWTKPQLGGWKGVLLENAITPIQQYSYTSGKNATDSAMIIDAMDILYSGKVDGFCVVSSDSDKKNKDKAQASVQKVDNRLLNLLKVTIQDQADDDGWAFLGEVGLLKWTNAFWTNRIPAMCMSVPEQNNQEVSC